MSRPTPDPPLYADPLEATFVAISRELGDLADRLRGPDYRETERVLSILEMVRRELDYIDRMGRTHLNTLLKEL